MWGIGFLKYRRGNWERGRGGGGFNFCYIMHRFLMPFGSVLLRDVVLFLWWMLWEGKGGGTRTGNVLFLRVTFCLRRHSV